MYVYIYIYVCVCVMYVYTCMYILYMNVCIYIRIYSLWRESDGFLPFSDVVEWPRARLGDAQANPTYIYIYILVIHERMHINMYL